MAGIRKPHQLAVEILEPGCVAGQQHLAGLDARACGTEPHLLVQRRSKGPPAPGLFPVDFLEQRDAAAGFLNDDPFRIPFVVQPDHSSL